MSDLIKREDAIEALAEILYEEPPYLNSAEKRMAFARNAMKDIPSAENKGEWIPCSERLPEETGIYLCTVGAPYRNPREMYYAPQEWADKTDNATWRNTDGSYVYDWFVEAWQPLPEPWERSRR